jgi:DNA-binding IscR family transcriptional regulator
MKISNKFTIGVHTLAVISYCESNPDLLCTSEFIAESVGTNPVIIRKVTGLLKNAGIISVTGGSGGAHLLHKSKDISLLDIYKAVEVVKEDELFNYHDNPNPHCPIGKSINGILRVILIKAEDAMKNILMAVSLEDIMSEITESSNK